MKNKEKYFDELIDLFFGEDEGTCCAFIKKHLNTTCEDYDECNSCNEKIKSWLEQEYVDTPRLSSDEYVILKNVDKTGKWIVRDRMNNLVVFEQKVYKTGDTWVSARFGEAYYMKAFNHLFRQIDWEDKKAYSVKELLEEYERMKDLMEEKQ